MMIRKSFKHLASLIMVPAVRWYLRKERAYKYGAINIKVSPGVFHPGFFSSTKFILNYLNQQQLLNNTLLELGCGSALISIVAAKKGAIVTASDLNHKATANAERNAVQNNASVNVVHSDLFKNIEKKFFDWIIINPPYYARTPQNEDQLAWFCGEHFEYFHNLFKSLKDYSQENTQVIMVLTKGCDVQKIIEIANAHGFTFELLQEKNVIFDEKDFLYKITKNQFS
jgi:release factor glutamine methyltransferase